MEIAFFAVAVAVAIITDKAVLQNSCACDAHMSQTKRLVLYIYIYE